MTSPITNKLKTEVNISNVLEKNYLEEVNSPKAGSGYGKKFTKEAPSLLDGASKISPLNLQTSFYSDSSDEDSIEVVNLFGKNSTEGTDDEDDSPQSPTLIMEGFKRSFEEPSTKIRKLSASFKFPAQVSKVIASSDFDTPGAMSFTQPCTPETPFKTKGKGNRIFSFAQPQKKSFVAKATLILDKLFEGITSASASSLQFTAGKFIGNGQHSDVYEIEAKAPLIEGYRNDQLLFKCYRRVVIERDSSSMVESYMDNSLAQYDQLVKLNSSEVKIPIAKILNVTSAKKDGFFIVERISHEFKFEENLDLDTLSDDHPLYQVKKIFQEAFDARLYLDLSKSNVRLDNAGKVILIDFMEHVEDDVENPFLLVLRKCLETFAKDNQGKINRGIYNFLMPIGVVLED